MIVRQAIPLGLALVLSSSLVVAAQPAISREESDFIGAALSYSAAALKEQINLLEGARGISKGTMSRDDFRKIVLEAQRTESRRYDYPVHLQAVVTRSPALIDVQQRLRSAHWLFQSAINEYLAFLEDPKHNSLLAAGKTLEGYGSQISEIGLVLSQQVKR